PSPMHLCWLFLTADRAVQNMDAVNWERVYWHLPLISMDAQTGRDLPAWRDECAHPLLDDWWRAICYQTRFDEINVPVLHISGWYDDEQIGTPKNYIGMSRQAPSEATRAAQRLIMGPWPHDVNTSTKLGEVDFGPQSLIDLRAAQVRFFDYWLKGIANGLDAEPPVSLFVMGVNEWRTYSSFPPQGVEYQSWHLSSRGRANSLFGDGRLLPEAPGENEQPDRYVYHPAHPVPFITEPTSSQIGGPDDYTPIHRRDDVLVYTSDPLTEALEVIGPVTVELYVSSSAPDTDFMAQLHDVWPNGYAQRLCDGMVRLRFRNGMDRPELLEPNTVVKVTIDCWYTAHVFKPGHRIRVHVTSSAFPKYDRNLNTGDPLGQTDTMAPAEQTVYHDAARPSAVILPVVR
ncbi:MAG: CocE/NonD family hydrolase, partial [Alicyclobacillus sp.]|nr:CocE/NonD family hydrolase [Alicyclobacillus sp.]